MKGRIVFFLATLILIFALGMPQGMSKEKTIRVDAAGMRRKFDEVLANQERMLKQFEEIRKELAIIKIRASR